MEKKLTIHNETKDWRVMFPDDLLNTAREMVKKGYISELSADAASASAVIKPRSNLSYMVHLNAPTSYYEDWDNSDLYCSCMTKRTYTYWVGCQRLSSNVCWHEAAVLLLWQERHGNWFFPAPPEIAEAQRKAEQEKREAEEREHQRKAELARIKEEKARLKAEKKAKEAKKLPAVSFFPGEEPPGTYFEIGNVLRKKKTN